MTTTPNTQHPHPMTTNTTPTEYVTFKLTPAEYALISVALLDARFAHGAEAVAAEADGRNLMAALHRRREADAIRADLAFEAGLFDRTRHLPTRQALEEYRRREVPTTPDGWSCID